MLKYFVMTVQDILLATILAGFVLAYMRQVLKEQGFEAIAGIYEKIAVFGSLVLSILAAIYKNSAKGFLNQIWNLRLYGVILGVFVIFWIFVIVGIFAKRVGAVGQGTAAMLLSGLMIFYAYPDVWAFPYEILLTNVSWYSSGFLMKMAGILLGLLLVYLASLALYKGCLTLSRKNVLILGGILLCVNEFKQIFAALSIMMSRRIIANNHTIFIICKNSVNYGDYYVYLALLLALIVLAIVAVRSFTYNEPYENSAQKRKIIAKWRFRRRWSILSLVTVILSVLSMTWFDALANVPVQLSPIEAYTSEDDENIYIDTSLVDDGKLHRFGLEAESGKICRIIVIQKPNGTGYAAGMDACDVCGETGYYEKNGQVICNKCDVVMNITTIGFPGGCNPFTFDYTVKNGVIIIPKEGILQYEDEFKLTSSAD